MKHLLVALLLMTMSGILPVPAAAQDRWHALVIGQSGGTGFGDAFHATQMLDRGGLDGILTLRDGTRPEVERAIAALGRVENALIYYAGALNGDGMRFDGGDDLRFSDVLAALSIGDTRRVALLVENCTGPGANGFATPQVPRGMALQVLASAGPGRACPADGMRLSDRMQRLAARPDLSGGLSTLMAGIWQGGTARDLFELPGRVQEDWIIIEPDPVARVADDIVSLVPIIDTAAQDEQLVPAGFARPAPSPTPSRAEDFVVFAAPPQSQLAALPLSQDLPAPSIIVGLIGGVTEVAYAPEPESAPADADGDPINIAYDNLAARKALRDQNRELFVSLLDSGAFDPPEEALKVALQRELKAMNCYRMSIDGDWGPGSQRSVREYYTELGQDAPSVLDATIALFRDIVRNDTVECPTPVAAPRPAVNRQPSRSAAAPVRRTQPAPAPAPTPRAAPTPTPTPRSGGIATGGAMVGNF
ncbi:hypothetical protein [Tropicibacter alexandrii]|uniref:hypothetical protein n=1 Tax=Tropicibacter alexandrii TaxID=2267683 RepID=UPI001008E0DD|nr:hypothetical protein [Tropicibacter alexandrii]